MARLRVQGCRRYSITWPLNITRHGHRFSIWQKGADATDGQRPVIAKQTYLNGLLADGRDYLLGNDFSVADTYLFAVTRWSVNFGISLEALPALQAFMARVEARPSVKAVLKAEGLPELFNKA
ncbi:Glutathione S-transferase [Pseudomonas syringae pv. antirrhini]|uniref:Glutathione S-transferase n=1 Tax=Pseudomonas syringae pv. antirrhini TaxID=251702 RepID=A0A0P9LY03_9PSED|nr:MULTISPECIES: glutathione binding-like protein [Pseudomonas]KPW49367.1 Glutathione S-transferase [Pseudomonas syringae pv. antirrhini]RMP36678.1 Glutathione S-transferase [Pseudomonas syringae pv. antirrhini]RMW24810.1 Glutathione S-transferase [Pseudomonas syringae pv. antirrhini]WIN08055.1 glutathione S-transferase family protein [Pseudomonas syringae pv. antirrhini str. 126]